MGPTKRQARIAGLPEVLNVSPAAGHAAAEGVLMMNPTKKQARVAGLLYLIAGLAAPIGLIYVPSKLIVSGNAAETANRIRAGEWLLRLGIGTELFHQVLFIFVVLALYRLFKGVNESLARLMVILGAVVSVPIVLLNAVNEVAALVLVKGQGFAAVLEASQRDALAYLFLYLHGQGIAVAEIFWGLWLFPFGILVVRSGFMPRVLGVLLMVAGAGYLADSAASLLAPAYAPAVSQVATVLEMGELPIIVWLLIWGVRGERAVVAA